MYGLPWHLRYVYIREEPLSGLLGGTVQAIQIPPSVADEIAAALRDTEGLIERDKAAARQRLEDRRRNVLAKLDPGYEDYTRGMFNRFQRLRQCAMACKAPRQRWHCPVCSRN